MKTQMILIVSILFFAGFQNLALGQNVQKKAYDINDPRNPDCPCHKLQQLAEREHEKQKQQSGFFEGNNTPVLLLLNGGNGFQAKKINSSGSEKTSKINLWSGQRKKVLNRFSDMRFRFRKKMMTTRKVRPDFSVCYKW